MATTTRPYLVEDQATGKKRLIQAGSQPQARNFVARNQYTVRIVSANEVISLMAGGLMPEVATDDPVAVTQTEPTTQEGGSNE